MVLGALAVIAAGAPMLITASADLSQSQTLVERAETGKRAVSLAHALANERDAQVRELAAKGAAATPGEPPARSSGGGTSGTPEPVDLKTPQKHVDSRVRELRTELPVAVRELVDAIPRQRQQARTASGDPDSVLDVHSAYTDAIQALGGLTEETARDLPSRATEDATSGSADPYALPYLGRRVEQAAATRALLLAALTAKGPQPALTSAAQRARLAEQTADADFAQTAHEDTRERVSTTVTGSEVTTAERYLERMTAHSRLSPAAQRFRPDRVDTTLTARVDQLRGVHSSLAGEEVARLERLRDDDVTSLLLSFVWVGAALLLAIGAGVYGARSMTRPLGVLRLGSARVAADPTNEAPVKFTGRNDEFAEVVRSLNEIHAASVELRERAETAEADAVRQAAGRKKLAADRARQRQRADELDTRLRELDGAVHGAFIQLASRNLSLTEQQLSHLEALEERESEPARLSTLFTLDHLATRMRRHGENLLLLAGAEHASHQHPEPVPLVDVLRAAISEIERYERVALDALPPHIRVAGFAADDISHLVAELLDNATAFSAPEAEVQLSGGMMGNGELMLSVADLGIGMTADRLATLNERLGEPEKQDPPSADGGDTLGVGLYLVARLAARHGVRVQLRVQKQGGVTAVVVLPRALLSDQPMPDGVDATTSEADTAPTPSTEVTQEPGDNGAYDGVEAAGKPEPLAADEAGSAVDTSTGPADAPAPPPDTEREARTERNNDTERAAETDPPAGQLPLTDKGLPKRTPPASTVGPPPAAVPVPRTGDDMAGELRRRLGGFQQGTREGERDAAAQLAAEDNSGPTRDSEPGFTTDTPPQPSDATGRSPDTTDRPKATDQADTTDRTESTDQADSPTHSDDAASDGSRTKRGRTR